MSDSHEQHMTLLQAILLELKCMNEAMRATASQGNAMPVLKHEGKSVLLTVNTKAQDWARGGGGGAGAEPADAGTAPQPKPAGGAPGTAAALDAALESLSAEDLNALIETAPALMCAVAEAVGRPLPSLRRRASLWVSTAAEAFDAVTSHSGQTKRFIADAMLGGAVSAAAPGEGLESRVAAAMQEIGAWSASAFRSAALQDKDDDFGRRFIEHGATCYANCFFRLQTALGDASPPPSATPS